MATDADTQKAAQAIQEQLAAHKIVTELGPLLGGAQELARELAGPKGQGRHIGGEGLAAMHKYTPESLLTLALLSRCASALEDIASAFENISRAAQEITRTSTTATAAPPPANAETSNAETAAGAGGTEAPAPAAVDAPTQG